MTWKRDPQPQPARGSGKIACPRCGAPNYATDAACLSCGADLEALRFHDTPRPVERKPAAPPALLVSPAPAPPGWAATRASDGTTRMGPGLRWRVRYRWASSLRQTHRYSYRGWEREYVRCHLLLHAPGGREVTLATASQPAELRTLGHALCEQTGWLMSESRL